MFITSGMLVISVVLQPVNTVGLIHAVINLDKRNTFSKNPLYILNIYPILQVNIGSTHTILLFPKFTRNTYRKK